MRCLDHYCKYPKMRRQLDTNNMKSQRQSNFELLRILCALMIIAGHVMMIHGSGEFGSFSSFVDFILNPWFACAVNSFVLLSGYFGIRTNTKKLWQMNDMVTFYSVILLGVACAWGGHIWDMKRDFLYLFPVLTKKYWFITVYFALCLLAPALNVFVEKVDRVSLKKTIWIGICLFVGVPTLSYLFNFNAVVEDAGYGIVSFCLLYLIGRYWRLYDVLAQFSRKVYLLTYTSCMLGCGMFQWGYSCLLGFPFTSFVSYNTVFIFVGSLALFGLFSKLDIGSNRFINWLSSFCLCSYVIHLHPLTFPWLFGNMLHVPELEGWLYIGAIFGLSVVIYIVCTIIETIRRSFYSYVTKILI